MSCMGVPPNGDSHDPDSLLYGPGSDPTKRMWQDFELHIAELVKNPLDWDNYFLQMACLVATKSKDRSTKVGAVVVGPDREIRTTGFNGFPRGVNDNIEARHERPLKYLLVAHAEANAIYNASRAGICTKDCVLYLNFAPAPCAECAKAIIQAGIVKIVVPRDRPFPGKGSQWEESIRVSKEMLAEAGVTIEEA